MNFVFRCFAEKRPGFDVEANKAFQELHEQLGIHGLKGVRIFNRYDVDGVNFGKDGDNGKNLNTYAAYIQDEWLLGDKWEIIP